MILTEMSKLEYFREEAFSSAWELAQIPRGDDRLDVYFQHVELPGKKDTGLHWHNCVQFSVVTRGLITYTVNQVPHLVQVGEGFFVNYGCLHSVSQASASPAAYYVVNMDFDYLFGGMSAEARVKYTMPFLSAEQLPGLLLQRSVDWQRQILDQLARVALAYQESDFGYELAVRNFLGSVWYTFIVANQNNLKQCCGVASTDDQRTKAIILFIRHNYMKKLTLQDISSSANISAGECCRLLRRTTRSSPIEYLNNYRIEQSIKLLLDTNDTILQISQKVGFGSVNHFISIFKRKMATTPKNFRKQYEHVPYCEYVSPHFSGSI